MLKACVKSSMSGKQVYRCMTISLYSNRESLKAHQHAPKTKEVGATIVNFLTWRLGVHGVDLWLSCEEM